MNTLCSCYTYLPQDLNFFILTKQRLFSFMLSHQQKVEFGGGFKKHQGEIVNLKLAGFENVSINVTKMNVLDTRNVFHLVLSFKFWVYSYFIENTFFPLPRNADQLSSKLLLSKNGFSCAVYLYSVVNVSYKLSFSVLEYYQLIQTQYSR